MIGRTNTDTPGVPFSAANAADNIFPLYSQLLGRRIYVVSSKNPIRFVIRGKRQEPGYGEAIIVVGRKGRPNVLENARAAPLGTPKEAYLHTSPINFREMPLGGEGRAGGTADGRPV